MASNKKLGNDFETEFCELLSAKGFWCHNMAMRSAGQPADVVAVKNGNAYLIDCKVCVNDRFVLSRIEENQHLAMELWAECGNGDGLFALKTSSGVWMVSYERMCWAEGEGKASLSHEEIQYIGIPLEGWCEV